MANLLKNPTLGGFKLVRYFTENSGNTGAIENPDDWEYVFFSHYPNDPNRIPQSLHRAKGFVIAAGYRKWEAGYVQRGVAVKKGQRYLSRAAFMPDVNFSPGQPADVTAIQWQFWMEGGGAKIGSGWRSTGKGAFKQNEETLFVFEAASDMKLDYYFKVKSDWEGNVCDFNLYELSLEEVPASYGGDNVPVLGASATTAAPKPDVVVTLPQGQTPSPDLPMGRIETLTQSLADIVTNDDLDVIVPGLRAMSQVTPNAAVVAAFMRLADVLDRLRK